MGKKGGSSWLTVVKRAFRSPTKDTSQKKSSMKREENEQDEEEEEEEKKREKRRWLFRKPCSNNNNAPTQNEAKKTTHYPPPPPKTAPQLLPPDQRHAIAVAAATAAAAEAAVATAQAAVEIIRLTRSSNPTSSSSVLKQSYAAVVIQTAFRGYLARRALVALKGILKLQAIIRGQNVRKQAKMTLKCMQALLRLQTRMRDHQARLSHDGGGGRKSMFAEDYNLWDSIYLRDIRERKSFSNSKQRICIPDDWNECPRTLEELEAALQARKEAAAALKRESSLACAFSQQIWDSSESRYEEHEKEEVDGERKKWLDKWMATKHWDACSRGSIDKRDSIIKTVEMDIPAQAGKQQEYYSTYSASANGRPKLEQQSPHNLQKQAHYSAAASPGHHRSLNHYNCSSNMVQQAPVSVTPSPSKTKPVQGRPSSPRSSRMKEEKGYSYSAANTPCSSLRSIQRLNRNSSSISCYSVSTKNIIEGNNIVNGGNAGTTSGILRPNYMAATESAKARVRSQSAPRQRPSTPERERGGMLMGAKKRLSFPVPPEPVNIGSTTINAFYGFSQNLRSPSFKSVQAGYVGMDLQSNQSCYTTTDSIGGEMSPRSTSALRRWLR